MEKKKKIKREERWDTLKRKAQGGHNVYVYLLSVLNVGTRKWSSFRLSFRNGEEI